MEQEKIILPSSGVVKKNTCITNCKECPLSSICKTRYSLGNQSQAVAKESVSTVSGNRFVSKWSGCNKYYKGSSPVTTKTVSFKTREHDEYSVLDFTALAKNDEATELTWSIISGGNNGRK